MAALIVLGGSTVSDSSSGSASSASQAGDSVRLVVSLTPGATFADIDRALTASGALRQPGLSEVRSVAVNVPANRASNLIAALSENPSVARVSPPVRVGVAGSPDDPYLADQWSLEQIGWHEAFETVSVSGTATIAVLDTGVDASHPDLAGRVLLGASFVGGDAHTDPHGHGTSLAGIAAANVNDATGVAGVAYAGVDVLPVQVLGADGMGDDVDVVAGLLWAVDQGADVILMGFSTDDYSPVLAEAIAYAWSQGAVIVAATGNDGSDAITYPSGMPHVLGVAATNRAGDVAGSSNTGSALVAAPGVGILTTAAGGDYRALSGTSAAVAHVAGIAALLAADGHANDYIFDQLRWASTPLDGHDFGRIDMAAALGTAASGDAVTPFDIPEGAPLTPTYEAAGNVSAVTFTGSTLAAAQVATWTIGFTAEEPLAATDRLIVRFPNDFDLTGITTGIHWVAGPPPENVPGTDLITGFNADAVVYQVINPPAPADNANYIDPPPVSTEATASQVVELYLYNHAAPGDPILAAGVPATFSIAGIVNGAGFDEADFWMIVGEALWISHRP